MKINSSQFRLLFVTLLICEVFYAQEINIKTQNPAVKIISDSSKLFLIDTAKVTVPSNVINGHKYYCPRGMHDFICQCGPVKSKKILFVSPKKSRKKK